MAQKNSINNATAYLQFPTNDAAPTPASGGILAVNTAHQPYYNNATDTYGLPLLNNGGAAPTEGDILVADSAGSWSLLPLATEGYVLTAGETTVSFAAPAASPGLATFLCQTSDNLPANGVDLSNNATQLVVGGTPDTVPGGDYYPLTIMIPTGGSNADPLSVFSSNGGVGHSWFWSATGASQTGYAGTEINMLGVPGTFESPLQPLSGYQAGIIRFGTGNGTNNPWVEGIWNGLADIKVICTGNQTTSNAPAKIVFATNAVGGATTGPIDRVTIDETGLLTASYGISSTALTLTTTPLATTSGGTGVASYTAGDTVYYASGTALSKLGIGSANTLMGSTGSAPAWVGGTPSDGQFLGYTTGDGIEWQDLPASGTVTSVGLTSTGGSITITGATSPITDNGTYNIELTDTYAPIVSGGSADTVGQAFTLGAGGNLVETTAITASSIVFLTIDTVNGLPNSLAQVSSSQGTITPGESFQIDVVLGAGADSVTVNWLIINP